MVRRGKKDHAAIRAIAGEMNRMRKLYCVTLLFFCAGAGARAQWWVDNSPPPYSLPAAPTIKQRQAPAMPAIPAIYQRFADPEEGVLQLDVTVTDASGKPVTGLDRADFTLLDNGKPAKILTFHESDQVAMKPDAPTELILVLDQLNLKFEESVEAKMGLIRYLRQDGGHLALPTSIYQLSLDGLSVTSQPSTDGSALASEIEKNRMSPVPFEIPFTVTGDEFRSAQLSRNALGSITLKARREPGRKLVVWMGYGWPLSGQRRDQIFEEITEFSARLREARITLYRVNAWTNPQDNFDLISHGTSFDSRTYFEIAQTWKDATPVKTKLEVLATQSGGAVYGIMDYADFVKHLFIPDQIAHFVSDSLARIVAENSVSYSLSFDPPRTESIDEYHSLKVEMRKPGLVAHARTGYYDEPVYYDQPRHIPAEHLSVAQLEQLLEQRIHESESQLDLELSNLELTERMSSAKLIAWRNRLPGKKAWQALVTVADASAFLDLPAAEIPPLPQPAMAEQREQLVRIVQYLGNLAPKLPSLQATRTTDRYEEPKNPDSESWKTAQADWSLHQETSNTVTVRSLNGGDFIESGSGKDKKAKKGSRYLETNGTFGAILTTVVSDAVYGKMSWGGWETGEPGPLAVFRYSVPENQSHFNVTHCCYPEDMGGELFNRHPGYHGEIAFDPSTGAILRLTVQTDLSEKLPTMRSDVVVEYGPVKFGDSTYICPVKSVSISRERTLHSISEWGERFQFFAPFETQIIDVSFREYHRFGSTSRILPDSQEAP
jgi:VWFA-related protein